MRRVWEPSLFPGNHLQRSGSESVVRAFFLNLLRVFTVAQGSLVSRVSEHPSGPRYMLLHFGTVPLCAGVTGNALQLFC